MGDAAPAHAAGGGGRTKSSDRTRLTCGGVSEGGKEIGAPPVRRHVAGAGETGEAVVEAVDFVQFTGSTSTGRRVATRCAELLKPVSLELGGTDAAIVLEDADLDRAAPIGRASCRERVFEYVKMSVVAAALKKHNEHK